MIIGDMEIRLRADIARLQRDMDQARRVVNDTASGVGRAADAMKSALAGIGLGIGLGAIARMADEYAKFTAQLRLATSSQREYATAMADVRSIANTAQQDLAAIGVLYARIANGTRELGVAQKQVASITETVNLALKVSGATAAESASAQLQLSQAFASGTLRGEEFNAVNEAAPRLMKALADGMGMPIGALKAMASNGEITSKIMADVLPAALGKLREEAKQVQTIGGALTVLKNSTLELVGAQAQASGAVAVINAGLDVLSRNIGTVAGAVTTLIAAKLGSSMAAWAVDTYRSVAANNALAASTLAAAVRTTEASAAIAGARLAEAQAAAVASGAAATLATARVAELRTAILAAEGEVALALALNGLIPAEARATALSEAHAIAVTAETAAAARFTVATGAATVALNAQTAAAGFTARAMGVLRGAMGFFGGPIGVIITLLGAAALAWSHFSDKAKESNEQVAESFDEAQVRIIKGLDDQIAKQEALLRLKGQGQTKQEAEKNLPFVQQIEAAQKKLEAMKAPEPNQSWTDFFAKEREMKAGIVELQEKLAQANAGAAAVDKQSTAERVKALKTEMATRDEKLKAELKGIEDLKGKTDEYDDLAARIRSKYADKTVAQSATEYQNLTTSIQEKIAANKLELSGGNALTESQKLTIKLDAIIASGKTKLSAESIKSARDQVAELAATEQQMKAKEDVIASNKRAAEGLAEFTKIQRAHDDQVAKSVQAANEEADKSEELVLTFGMTKAAIEQLELARLQDQLAQRASTGMTFDEIAALEQLIDAKKRNVAATGNLEALEANKKANEEMIAEYKRTVDKYDDVFRTGFADMLNHGKSGWKSFTTSLLTTFKTTVADQIYKMMAQPFVVKLVGSLLGVVGGNTAQAAAGALGAGGASSSMGLLNAGKTIYEGFTTGFAGVAGTLGGYVSQLGALFGSSSMSAFGAGMGLTSSQAATAAAAYNSAGMAGTGSALTSGAAAAPWVTGAAGVVGGYLAGDAISGQFGNKATTATGTAIGAAIGTYILPGLGTALGGFVGGLVGGVVNRAFGMGDKKVTGEAIEGTLSPTGVTGNNLTSWTQKGGWFRSDKSGTTPSALTGEQTTAFGTTYKAILDVSKTLGTVIGADTSALSTRVQKLSIDFKGLTTDAEKAGAITKFFEGVADTIALEMVPNLKSFQKEGESISVTMQRVVTNYASLDNILASMGTTFGATGVSSITAREGFIAAAGGLDKLASGASYFQQNFLTEAEQLAPVQKQLTEAMASLGLSSITTVDQFKQYVLGIDKTTEGGSKLFAQMLALAPAFKQITDATDALAQSAKDAADAAVQAAKEQADALAAALAEANAGYRQQIDALLAARAGEAAVRVLEIRGMDATTVTLYDRLAALKAEDKALADAKVAAEALAKAQKDAAEAALQAAREAAAALGKALLGAVDSMFNSLTTAVNAQKKALESANKASMDAMQAQIGKTSAAVSKQTALSSALHSSLDSVRGLTESGPADQADAQAQIAAALAIARASGVLPDADALKGALATLAKDSSDQFSSYTDYQRSNYQSALVISDLADLTDSQLSVEQMMLDSLEAQKDLAQLAYEQEVARLDGILENAKAQVDALNGINTGIASIPAALAALADSIKAAMANPIASAGSAASSAYPQYLGRSATTSETDFWKGQAGNGVDVVSAIKGSDEAKIQDLYKTLLGRTGEAAGVDLWESALAGGMSLEQIKASFMGSEEYKKLHPFAVGTNFVPGDMPALIHEGERIIPAADNRELMSRLSGPGGDNGEMLAELREQRRENAELRVMLESHLYAIAKSARNTEDFLDGAVNGNTPLATKAVPTEETA